MNELDRRQKEIQLLKNSIKDEENNFATVVKTKYSYKGNVEFQILKDIESNKKLELNNDEKLNDLLIKMLKININERISCMIILIIPFLMKIILNYLNLNLIAINIQI